MSGVLVSPPPKLPRDKTPTDGFDRWLYQLWAVTKAQQESLSNGSAGQVYGIDEDGDAAYLTLDGGDNLSVSIDGTTITIDLSEAFMDQLAAMKLLLEKILLEQQQQTKLMRSASGSK